MSGLLLYLPRLYDTLSRDGLQGTYCTLSHSSVEDFIARLFAKWWRLESLLLRGFPTAQTLLSFVHPTWRQAQPTDLLHRNSLAFRRRESTKELSTKKSRPNKPQSLPSTLAQPLSSREKPMSRMRQIRTLGTLLPSSIFLPQHQFRLRLYLHQPSQPSMSSTFW